MSHTVCTLSDVQVGHDIPPEQIINAIAHARLAEFVC